MKQRPNSAGTHVLIDGYVDDLANFEPPNLKTMFKTLAHLLDMTIIDGPFVTEVPTDLNKLKKSEESGVFEDDGGTTVFCVISTSHMSIHVWPLKKFFSMDVFSCRDFDPHVVLDAMTLALQPSQAVVQLVHRERPVLPEGV